MLRNTLSRLLIVILFLGLLNGCNVVSLVYDHADWLVLWRIDHYFDTSPKQEQFLENRVHELHQWHRTHELPLYAEFLRHVQQRVKTGLTEDKLDETLHEYQVLRAHLAEQLAFHGTPFLINLKPEQHAYFQSVLQEENRDLQQDFSATPEERIEHRMESVMSILDFWVGDVTSEQTETINRYIQDFPDTTDAYIRYRKYRQQQLVGFLSAPQDVREFEHQIAEWISSNGKDIPDEFYSGVQQWQDAVKDTILKIDRIIHSEQRDQMVSKLQSFIDQIETLFPTS